MNVDDSLVDAVRQFVRERITPRTQSWNEEGSLPDAVVEEMTEFGLFGLMIPSEYGGSGCSFSTFFSIMEELAAGDAGISTLIHVHNLGPAILLSRLGDEAQKAEWLPRMATGKVIGAVGLSEPVAGSDVSSIKTRATRMDGGWILNGSKQFISNGARSGMSVSLAVTDPDAGSQGMTFFLIPTGTEGYTIGPPERKMGQHTSDTTQLFFEDCFVPDSAVVGGVGQALHKTMGALNDGRISSAFQSVGIARSAYELALAYSQERQAFGKPISQHQAVSFMLADMFVQIDVARQYAHYAARLLEDGKDCVREASAAKLFAAEMAERVCSSAIQIHGGYGYLRDYHVEQLARDARVCQIYEGTNEIQRLIIARGILTG